MKQKNLVRMIRKVRPYCGDGKVFVGHLTAVEILHLIELGAVPESGSEYQLKYIKEYKENGDGGGLWFYFYPRKFEPIYEKWKGV